MEMSTPNVITAGGGVGGEHGNDVIPGAAEAIRSMHLPTASTDSSLPSQLVPRPATRQPPCRIQETMNARHSPFSALCWSAQSPYRGAAR